MNTHGRTRFRHISYGGGSGGRAPLTALQGDLGQVLSLPGQLPRLVTTLDHECIPRLLSGLTFFLQGNEGWEITAAFKNLMSFLGKVVLSYQTFFFPLILWCCQCPKSGAPRPDFTEQLEKLRPRAGLWRREAAASQGHSGLREIVKVTSRAVNSLAPSLACSFRRRRAGHPACHGSRGGRKKTPRLSLGFPSDFMTPNAPSLPTTPFGKEKLIK